MYVKPLVNCGIGKKVLHSFKIISQVFTVTPSVVALREANQTDHASTCRYNAVRAES